MEKTTQLRKLIECSELSFIMEAHNGLSARIVEEQGFKAIWASGLTISGSQAMRDSNELTMTEVVRIWEKMCDAVEIPMICDVDTGYGTFNEARRLVKECEKIGVAGVIIEDKLFPKKNSFIAGESQKLADIEEHSLKIRAMKETQKDPDFLVVARLESFITGLGLNDAMKRAHSYINAGADALLVHSKRHDAKDIHDFQKHFTNHDIPVIIVPTKYYTIPTQVFRDLGINAVIWANHLLRASITAMQDISKQIFEDQSLLNIEDKVASVKEIFRLQHDNELRNAEKIYMPAKSKKTGAIILAASRGAELNELTEYKPKALIKIGHETLLSRQIRLLNVHGITDLIVVGGYGIEHVRTELENQATVIGNPDWEITKEGVSLMSALSIVNIMDDDYQFIISFGDIMYKRHILHDLLNSEHENVIVADINIDKTLGNDKDRRITAVKDTFNLQMPLSFIECNLSVEGAKNAEFIGLAKMSRKSLRALCTVSFNHSKELNNKSLIQLILDNHKNINMKVMLVDGGWHDVNNLTDLAKI